MSRSMTIEDPCHPHRDYAPFTPRRKRWIWRRRALGLLLGSVLTSAMPLTTHVWAETPRIHSPAGARRLGLESLRLAVQQDGGVPLPSNLDEFVKDRETAVQLGKALFWDMQVGSDGVQACASCHFHAGTDNRSKNALNPALRIIFDHHDGDVEGYFNAEFANAQFRFEKRQPNETLTREDFPFVQSIQELHRTADGVIEPGVHNTNDIAGSMGMLATRFDGVRPGRPVDFGTPQPDSVFHTGGQTTVRRVEPRNTPTVINAIFNFTNFWDGRALPHFQRERHVW